MILHLPDIVRSGQAGSPGLCPTILSDLAREIYNDLNINNICFIHQPEHH
jgi:hypothetical protein